MYRLILLLLLTACASPSPVEVAVVPDSKPAARCERSFDECRRLAGDPLCPHGMAYYCECAVDVPDHCEWEGPNLVCCDEQSLPPDQPWLPPSDPPSLCSWDDHCDRLLDLSHELCPLKVAYQCDCAAELPARCSFAGRSNLVCCMALI